ncbi:MAG TPA: LamB/YcsF family protein, partial [Thermoanaerobaculia bacterium]|nr:LamB/YcsF family protein [Thermoanaerobaculia bacterium]
MRSIDLSCDLGEAESAHDREIEASLWPLVTSVNVACGGHAGDRDSMEVAIRRASELGVVLGAHPSYPDRLHFGRVSLPIRGQALRDALVEQLEELCELSHDAGMRVSHVKPHGALYNDAHHDAELAGSVAETVRSVDTGLAMVAAAGSSLLAAAKDAGLQAIAEAFADRRYRADGSLVPRSEPDALLL